MQPNRTYSRYFLGVYLPKCFLCVGVYGYVSVCVCMYTRACVCVCIVVVYQVVCTVGQCDFSFTASIKALFRGRTIFSEEGSNKRQRVTATYMLFGDFLEECRGQRAA